MCGPPPLQCGTARLLAVLWAVAGCTAIQQPQPPAELTDAEPHRDWLGALVSQAVKSATEPLFAQLADRVDKLDSKLDGLAIRLDNQDHKLNGLATRLDNRDSELNNYSSKLDGLVIRLDNQDSKLDGLVARLSSQDSKLDGLVTGQSSQDSKLDGVVAGLSSQDSKMNNHSSKLDGLITMQSTQDSKLDVLVAGQSTQDFKLDGMVAGLSSQDSKLDGLDTTLANQSSKLDTQLTQLDRLHSEVSSPAPPPRDCSDLPAGAQSGVHQLGLGLDRSSLPVRAYCDLNTDGGGWTVFQRRANIQPRQNFFVNWTAYKEGFGELDAEFWWGLDNLWTMTSRRDRRYELRINLEDADGEKRHAVYQGFRISSECDGYRLAATNYTGDAGDNLDYHVGHMFSTEDRDQDSSGENCAVERKSGWWHNSCTETNLNGPNRPCVEPKKDCITWYAWKGAHHSLKSVDMKIRPA